MLFQACLRRQVLREIADFIRQRYRGSILCSVPAFEGNYLLIGRAVGQISSNFNKLHAFLSVPVSRGIFRGKP